jgi:tetratricopeptide (TPR) repeat protein
VIKTLPDTIYADQLTEPIDDPGATARASPGLPPSLSGYMIIGPPKRGGMGTVWPAKQLGTKRTVAIKILGTQHLTAGGQTRFIREVELSAQLQHPNIARIYDSGVHQGDYFYAMEMIDGLSLDEYVAKHKCNQTEILELMRLVCQAVQHAHLRGVIHCDLKPANVLVSEDGQPHVLDFGLARLTTTSPDGLTENGSAPGTISWMSPEQAAGRLELIDIRSDVYSLGKMFYQLLTGQRPHRLDGPVTQVLHRIATEEVRPPREVCPALSRELSAVLLKALKHDPEARYASAGELAADIRRFLASEPVAAWSASMPYQLRKWVSRRRVAVSIAAAVLGVLISVGVTSQILIHQQAVKALRVSQFNQRLLWAMNPAESGRDMTEELVTCARAASVEFADEPLVQADLLQKIGTSLYAFGQLEAAQAQFQMVVNLRTRHIGVDDARTLAAKERLAQVSREHGDFELAEQMCNDILRSRNGRLGEGHRQTQRAKIALAQVLEDRAILGGEAQALSEAEKVLRDAIHVCQRDFGANDSDTLAARAALVPVLRVQGGAKLAEADSLSQETFTAREALHGLKHRQTVESLHDRANVLVALGRPVEAIAAYENLFEAAIQVPGWSSSSNPDTVDHPDLLLWLNDWAYALAMEGKYEKASEILTDILPRSIKYRGVNHPFNVIIQQNLAATLIAQKKWAEGEKLLAQAAATREDKLGPDHLETLRLRDLQAWAMTGQGKWKEAVAIYEYSVQSRQKKLSPDDPAIELSKKRLAIARSHLPPATAPASQPH